MGGVSETAWSVRRAMLPESFRHDAPDHTHGYFHLFVWYKALLALEHLTVHLLSGINKVNLVELMKSILLRLATPAGVQESRHMYM